MPRILIVDQSLSGNAFSYASGVLAYRTEHGDWLEVVGEQPMVNGTPDLQPAKTYDSPYLNGWHGEDLVTVTYPGYAPIELDFDYTTY